MEFLDSYKKILSLRDNNNAQKRGYLFEQLLRESLPWTSRPPITISTKTEQLDGFFEWNSWHFLLEAKAKKKTITAGSHDWEDFALKVRKRSGMCIGLFCSLFNVNNDVIHEGDQLNRLGLVTIIISGSDWNKLNENQIPLHKFLKYMVFQAKSKQTATAKSFTNVREWIYNRHYSSKVISRKCLKGSSMFLRRHRLVRHDQIYVKRTIDEKINAFSRLLYPSRTRKQNKQYTHGNKSFIRKRAIPKQICIIRDLSGAGKTTLAVEIAGATKFFFGISKAALQNDIDDDHFLVDSTENDFSLKHLIAVDKPVIYVVDSLDEASMIPGKHKEIRSIFRLIEQLNKLANNAGLTCFPLGVIFTIREDFWRDFESVFEGTHSNVFLKRFSNFTLEQTTIAIKKYSKAYSFYLSKPLDKQSRKVLSHPFNLQIFAEANEYRGPVFYDEILDENVLSLYFERKQEDVMKRPIFGFNPNMLMPVCSIMAVHTAKIKKNSISYPDIREKILELYPVLSGGVDMVIRMIISEQIIVRDQNIVTEYRFRHMRFVEYLVAFYISDNLFHTNNPKVLDELTTELVTGDFISLYYVHEFVRHICKTQFPTLYETLTDYYSQSSDYMNKLIKHRRSEIAYGELTTNLDMDAIDKATASGNPMVCWDGFFVLSAKNNKQNSEKIVTAFSRAWEKNPDRKDRWKLIFKLSQRKLLLDEKILGLLIISNEPKDWFVFIDGIISHNQFAPFKDVWEEINGESLIKVFKKRNNEEWGRVVTYIEYLLLGKGYNIGE